MTLTPTAPAAARPGHPGRRIAVVLLVFALGVLVGLLVGLLLSPRCRQCLGGTARVSGDASGGTGSGPPSKISIGRGAGQGDGGSATADGDTQGHGHTGDAQGVAGSASAGGGQGKGEAGVGGTQQSAEASDPLRTAVLKRLQGVDGGTGDPGPNAAQTPTGKLLWAPDLSYDRTALPRYPHTQRVESALSFPRSDDTQSWRSSVGMMTSDSFDAVVAWYRAQLPAGWQVQSLGDMRQLAQQLSIQNLAAMLGAATAATATRREDSAPASAPASSDPGPRTQVAIFSPPAGAAGKPGVMVTAAGDQPVTIMLRANSP